MINDDNMKGVPCLCKSCSYSFLYEAITPQYRGSYPFKLYKCEQCGLIRVYPVPDMSLYTNGYGNSTASNGEYIQRAKEWCTTIADEVKIVSSLHPELKQQLVLDIGCNGGELVEALNARGLKSEGCDIDPIAVAHGVKQGLNLFCQDLSLQNLNKKYGIVIMSHTLEHLVSPNDVLNNIHQALLPGGLLYIRVPNFNGWIAQIMKERWGFLIPQEHIWQFTPQTLKFHVESEGKFKVVDIRCKSNMEYRGKGRLKSFVKEIIKYSAVMLNHGDEIVAIFRKN